MYGKGTVGAVDCSHESRIKYSFISTTSVEYGDVDGTVNIFPLNVLQSG